uniref:C-type lectin domain-containing protein n=1 Tax=Xiphophorus couchianus TaxID=32473 RepID=A0A3B5LX65_9TELE
LDLMIDSILYCVSFPLRKYYYVNQLVTWPKAQQFCREHYTDLATFESLDDIKRLQPNISYSWAWIGLWDDPNAWQTMSLASVQAMLTAVSQRARGNGFSKHEKLIIKVTYKSFNVKQ